MSTQPNIKLIDLILSIWENSYNFGYHLKDEKNNTGEISWNTEKGGKYQTMEVPSEYYERACLIKEAKQLAYYEPDVQQVSNIKSRIMFRNDPAIMKKLNF